MVPDFDTDGNLPPGIYSAAWQEFCDRFGATPQRARLIVGLKAALDTLRTAGCQQVYIDGSFVTEKESPNDYDACWDITNVRPELLDPLLLKFDDGRVAQKTKYLGDLFPAQTQESLTGRTFLEFFQVDKETGNPKGIIVLNIRSLEQ